MKAKKIEMAFHKILLLVDRMETSGSNLYFKGMETGQEKQNEVQGSYKILIRIRFFSFIEQNSFHLPYCFLWPLFLKFG